MVCERLIQTSRKSAQAAVHGAIKQKRTLLTGRVLLSVLLQGKLLPYGAGKYRRAMLIVDLLSDPVQLLRGKPVSPTHVRGVCVCARQVAAWCESYRALRAMGFAPEAAGGALTLHPDSLADATEACLAAQ